MRSRRNGGNANTQPQPRHLDIKRMFAFADPRLREAAVLLTTRGNG
jgi:hypothetical protein